jgi:dihydroorotate dehydrogenase
MDLYQHLVRPILFSGLRADPEWLHQQSMQRLSWLARVSAETHPRSAPVAKSARRWLQQACSAQDPRLAQSLWNLSFPNPVGLAAGFDKNGTAAAIWQSLGFGFAELGTVTLHAQPGNPKPRLFRLIQDQAALNRMGFNNRGAAAMAAELSRVPPAALQIPMGINLGKSKITPLATAAADYQQSFQLLRNLGDYFVVNVSSPNTPGLRSLQARDQLEPILSTLQQDNTDCKPLFVKIAPDLDWDEIAAVVDLAREYELTGVIATNTTIRRTGLKTEVIDATGNPVTAEAGGISGAPLRQHSTDIIRFIWKHTDGQFPIIGVGGIFTAADAWEKITAGATLVQLYTGWIYEGPMALRRIVTGLGDRLTQHQLAHISEAVGLEHRQPAASTPNAKGRDA